VARIATASKELQPDVATVGFDFDGTYFYVGGLNLPRTFEVQERSKQSESSAGY
jgi:hypothetical protein